MAQFFERVARVEQMPWFHFDSMATLSKLLPLARFALRSISASRTARALTRIDALPAFGFQHCPSEACDRTLDCLELMDSRLQLIDIWENPKFPTITLFGDAIGFPLPGDCQPIFQDIGHFFQNCASWFKSLNSIAFAQVRWILTSNKIHDFLSSQSIK